MRRHSGEPDAPGQWLDGRTLDAWLRACPCGVEVAVVHLRGRGVMSWVASEGDPDIDHVLHHLALPWPVVMRFDQQPDMFPPWRVEPWLLRRYDDNGQHFDVHRFASRQAAECSLRTFQARGQRQTYVIEPIAEAPHPARAR